MFYKHTEGRYLRRFRRWQPLSNVRILRVGSENGLILTSDRTQHHIQVCPGVVLVKPPSCAVVGYIWPSGTSTMCCNVPVFSRYFLESSEIVNRNVCRYFKLQESSECFSLLSLYLFSQVKYYCAEDYEVRCFEEAIREYQVSLVPKASQQQIDNSYLLVTSRCKVLC